MKIFTFSWLFSTPRLFPRARFFVPVFALLAGSAFAAPKTILISLDGATPRLVDQFATSGAIPAGTGLLLLENAGVKALQNFTISPSLTAAAHIAIATGSTAANNDVVANGFRLLATPNSSGSTVSGFSAPIGGYSIDGPAETGSPTARPLWLALRAAGKVVATATWPGGDGINVTVPGLSGSPIIQSADKRTVDYTVPFGSATTPFQKGFPLASGNFGPAPQATVDQLAAAGHPSFSPVRQTNLETFSSGGQSYDIKLAAIDSTDDGAINYDTLVFFDANHGGIAGPFTAAPLGTGPAYIRPAAKISALFYYEGHSNKAGTRYFVSNLAPDLSTVRVARTSATFLPRFTPVPQVLADVDDINNNVGFWQPQPDFRIVERIDATPSTFVTFPDLELEAIYTELVREFVQYQTRVGLRAITRFPNADLVMIYIEQPDGSGHQFLLTDPRQPTDFTKPNSIGAGQDAAKIARYNNYLATAYAAASDAVQNVINAVGVNKAGVPNSNIFVVSDHGFAPFHTAVQLQPILQAAGIDTTKLRIVTSGPAANVYINLLNRPDGGANTVTRDQYIALQKQVADALQNYADTNPNYTQGAASVPVFQRVYTRPLPADINDPTFGRRRTDLIAQDSGDVYALLSLGYNFDGRQTPAVTRKDDVSNVILSLPNFYGAHGYDPTLPEMSAIFYAAGPNITHLKAPIAAVSNIDVVPTLMRLLGVAPDATVDGSPLQLGPAPVMSLQRAVSRKNHGAAGAREVVLPLAGSAGVEPRRAGSGNTHTLVFQFSNQPVSGSAAVTSGAGSVNGPPTFSGNEMTVNLTGVTDTQQLRLTLTNVMDNLGGTVANAPVDVVFLRGDVTGDRTVNPADVAEVNSLGHDAPALTNLNFRGDLNVSGTINTTDAALARANLGHSVP